MMDPKVKLCKKCGTYKLLDNCFHRNKKNPDGHAYECKSCAKTRVSKHPTSQLFMRNAMDKLRQ